MVAGGFASSLLVFLCRSSYYVNLIGLKIPFGLLIRASRARHAFAFLLLCVLPFLAYCHLSLLPLVRTSEHAALVWQVLLAMWVTIPTILVGFVIVMRMQAAKLCVAFVFVLSAEMCVHLYAVNFLKRTAFGNVILHVLFAYFEVLPVLGWLWCLHHVVVIQNHVEAQTFEAPIAAPKGPDDRVLIVGNAPTVTDGSPLGKEIDDFTNVVRFNGYSVSKPEYTGSRTDFHFCNGRQVASNRGAQVVLPHFYASLTHAAYLFFPNMEEARRITDNLTSDQALTWFVDEPRLLELMKKLGLAFWQVPTSGMVAIDAFLSKNASVSLHGFNFFQSKKIHYHDESPTQLVTSWLERFMMHDPSKEQVWVRESLMKEGRASFLADSATPKTLSEAKGEEVEEEEDDRVGETDKQPRQRPSLLRMLSKTGI